MGLRAGAPERWWQSEGQGLVQGPLRRQRPLHFEWLVTAALLVGALGQPGRALVGSLPRVEEGQASWWGAAAWLLEVREGLVGVRPLEVVPLGEGKGGVGMRLGVASSCVVGLLVDPAGNKLLRVPYQQLRLCTTRLKWTF